MSGDDVQVGAVPEAQVVADLADKAHGRKPVTLVEDRLLGFVLAPGQVLETVDLDEYDERPFRATGLVTLADADSFATYVKRHTDVAATTLWANLADGAITAVLNDHPKLSAEAGWGDHRAVLGLQPSPDWTHWVGADGKLMSQTEFAEHVEAGSAVIRKPDPASMLEIAQTFHASTGVEFKSSTRLASGETQLRYEETTTANAGRKASIEIPDQIVLGLEPFDESPKYELVARFRYRIQNGTLRLGYRLIRPDLARKAAFTDVVAAVSSATGLDVLAGIPRK